MLHSRGRQHLGEDATQGDHAEMIETSFIFGLTGGLIIGTAASLYLLLSGRIMGASGILGAVVDGSAGSGLMEKLMFLIGLVVTPWLVTFAFDLAPETHASSNVVVIIAAGLLVGLGTRLANGCTSGQGVCGISRLSLRGIVATLFYLFGGGVTVLLFKQVLGVI